MKKIYLKPGKEKAIINRHPWIFSGAIESADPEIVNGEIITVVDSQGNRLGNGYANSLTDIQVRMLAFDPNEFDSKHLTKLITAAYAKRLNHPLLKNTDSYRLIFSESDFLPGLIVDNYAGHLVVQFLTLGMDKMKTEIVDNLVKIIKPKSIYEKSDHDGRRFEGLEPISGQLHKKTPAEIKIIENNLFFLVNVAAGQKTGFYLDQRDNRKLIQKIAAGKNVLNLFSYTGSFGVAALAGGAKSVTSIDASKNALELSEKNFILNKFNPEKHGHLEADIFEYLKNEPINSDLIIIDPPALAKNRSNAINACHGYQNLNYQAIKKCPPNSLILTCSCSRFINMELWQKVIFAAAVAANRQVTIIGKYGQPVDHSINIFCPETEYLKAMLLLVE